MVFDGYKDGPGNYSYIRELRNAVVHRGLDITSGAHIDGNFPMILAVPEVQNQSGKKKFFAFGNYLLEIIAKCESVIGRVMLDYLNDAGIFETTIDAEADVAEFRKESEQSHVIPEAFKAMAWVMEVKPEWVTTAHKSEMTKLREALQPCNASKPSAA